MIVPQHLPAPPKGRTLVVGAGEEPRHRWRSARWSIIGSSAGAPLEGTVITRYAHGLLTNRISVIEAGHPVPDEAGEKAAQRIFDSARLPV